MKKRIFKKIYPTQYPYVGDTNTFQYVEDIYTVYEGEINGTKICFYNRTDSVTYKTTDGGETYTKDSGNINAIGFFTIIGVAFDDIIDKVISSRGGIIKEVTDEIK